VLGGGKLSPSWPSLCLPFFAHSIRWTEGLVAIQSVSGRFGEEGTLLLLLGIKFRSSAY